MEKENKQVAEIAQRLISEKDVQKVLSEPLSYDLQGEVPKKNDILTSKEFKILSSKMNLLSQEEIPFYSVVEHDELKGWVIKSGANRIPKDQLMLGPMNDLGEVAFFTEEESLLRIEMAKRVQEVALQSGFKDVIVPKKKLVAYANSDQEKDPTRKYCVLCEKIDVLSTEETIEEIGKMNKSEQIATAKKISEVVEKAGLVDASFNNIRLTKERKIVFLDTEPGGLIVAKKEDLWNGLFGNKGASVEKCARLGLFTLMGQLTKAARKEIDMGNMFSIFSNAKNLMDPAKGFEAFHSVVKEKYEQASNPRLSWWKIGLSFASLGLVALVNAVVSFVKIKLVEQAQKEVLEKQNGLLSIFGNTEKANTLQKEIVPIQKRIYAHIEGVPFKIEMLKLF